MKKIGRTNSLISLIGWGTNAIFLSVAILLLRLYSNYRKSGYFEKDSLRLLDKVILACLLLAFVGLTQTAFENAAELHLNQWTSLCYPGIEC